MNFTIVLPRYSYAKSYPREEFTQLFPESMIVSALELMPGTQEISLTQEFVTPGVLDLIETMVVSKATPMLENDDPLRPTLSKAGPYLGIPLLSIIGHPKYTDHIYCIRDDINLFALSTYPEAYNIFSYAVYHQITPLVELCLDIGMDPSTDIMLNRPYRRNWIFSYVCRHGNLSLVNRLLKDSRVDPTIERCQFMANGQDEILQRLLQDTRIIAKEARRNEI